MFEHSVSERECGCMTYTSFCILSYVNALTILVCYFLSGTIPTSKNCCLLVFYSTLGYCFWNSPTIIESPGSVMDVHDCFEPHPPLLKKLYVRQCYENVWFNTVTKYLSSNSANEYLCITGTPGIGKTAFLYYLLCQLKSCNYEVLLHFGKTLVFLSSKPMPPPELFLTLGRKA